MCSIHYWCCSLLVWYLVPHWHGILRNASMLAHTQARRHACKPCGRADEQADIHACMQTRLPRSLCPMTFARPQLLLVARTGARMHAKQAGTAACDARPAVLARVSLFWHACPHSGMRILILACVSSFWHAYPHSGMRILILACMSSFWHARVHVCVRASALQARQCCVYAHHSFVSLSQ